MKRYLKDLKPTELNDISAMVSLYRPGPMELIPSYIARKYGKEEIRYLYPSLEPILKETYGIMIYQEQLIKAVQVLAGFTLAQADVLRKAIGKKIKKLLDEQEGAFKSGCEKVGTPKIIADKFWALVEPFNRYGFNKSHAVSYAMIAYQTAYLKSNFPLQFMVAEMNSDTNIDRIGEIIDELHSMGIKISSPDINISGNSFVSKENKIRFALSAIKGMSSKAADIIIEERKNGEYKSVEDFLIRTGHGIINKKSLELLAKSGAVDNLTDRNTMLDNIPALIAYTKCEDNKLLPPLVLLESSTSIGQKLSWEKELIGLYLSANPANNYYQEIKKHGVVDIKQLEDCKQRNINIGGIITSLKKVVTRSGKILYLIKLLDTSGEIEIPIYGSIYTKHAEVLKQNNVVILFGKLDNSNDRNKFTCLSVNWLATMA
jgi:DNA polymerase-3 subunit alpha